MAHYSIWWGCCPPMTHSCWCRLPLLLVALPVAQTQVSSFWTDPASASAEGLHLASVIQGSGLSSLTGLLMCAGAQAVLKSGAVQPLLLTLSNRDGRVVEAGIRSLKLIFQVSTAQLSGCSNAHAATCAATTQVQELLWAGVNSSSAVHCSHLVLMLLSSVTTALRQAVHSRYCSVCSP